MHHFENAIKGERLAMTLLATVTGGAATAEVIN